MGRFLLLKLSLLMRCGFGAVMSHCTSDGGTGNAMTFTNEMSGYPADGSAL